MSARAGSTRRWRGGSAHAAGPARGASRMQGSPRRRRVAPVDGVVHPTAALLHAHAAPLGLRQKAALGRILGNVLGQDDVPERSARGTVRRRSKASRARDQEPEEQRRVRSRCTEPGCGPAWRTGTRTRRQSTSPNTRCPGPSWCRGLREAAGGQVSGRRAPARLGCARAVGCACAARKGRVPRR